jgi:hypothetical protein
MPMEISAMVISLLIIIVVIYAFYRVMKILVYNTVAGLVLLVVMNFTIFAGNPVDITLPKVVLTAIAGIIGAVLIGGLHYLDLFGV